MTVAINEDTYAERPALEWLEEAGWTPAEGKDLAPGAPGAERASYKGVILTDRLRSAVKDLNPELPTNVIDQVVAAVRATDAPTPILDHQAFHRLLTGGVSVTYRDDAGVERSPRVKLINWEHPGLNDFLAVRQVVIIGPTDKNDRTDILLYVNGSHSARSS